MGQGGQGGQGNRIHARKKVGIRVCSNHQDFKQDQPHICEERSWSMATSESPAFGRASYAAMIEVGYRRRSKYEDGKQGLALIRGAKLVYGEVRITCDWSCVLRAAHSHPLHLSARELWFFVFYKH